MPQHHSVLLCAQGHTAHTAGGDQRGSPRRRLRGHAAIASVAALAAGLQWGAGWLAPARAAVGFRAPGFELGYVADPSGRLSLSEMSGRPVVLIFNCGCKLCRDFDRCYAAGAAGLPEARTITVVTNPWAFQGERGAAFRRGTGFRWPLLSDSDGRVAAEYRSAECPRVWLIDRRGVVRYRNLTNLDPPRAIMRQLVEAYRKSSAR